MRWETTGNDRDRGAGLVEYALIVMMIALTGMVGVKAVGENTSDSFETVATSISGEAKELTPEQRWDKAQKDYDKALADALAKKTADLASANDTYNAKVKENSTLPKAEKNAANKVAKNELNAAKTSINAEYKATTNQAKTSYNAAKKEWNAYQKSK